MALYYVFKLGLRWVCVSLLLDIQSVAYNIDTENVVMYSIKETSYGGDRTDFNNSYFGFSLAFYDKPDGFGLLAGAPKSTPAVPYKKRPRISRAGGVFFCQVKKAATSSAAKQGCEELENVPYEEKNQNNKTDQFLGVSLAVSPKSNWIVVCGHRQIYVADLSDAPSYHMPGGCSIIKGLQGSTTKDLDLGSYSSNSISAGVSVEYGKNGDMLLLGAPLRWITRGMAFVFKVLPLGHIRAGDNITPLNMKSQTNFGYDVTSGVFDKSGNVSIAISAPGWTLRGKIGIYRKSDDLHRVISASRGQVGSYFGFKLCTCDINGDKLDELLVGAPLYKSKDKEEGRVYVYTNVMSKPVILSEVSGVSFGGRFGSSIACGDLDADGYSDVVIGAPYADNGHGMLYVYNGGPAGLADKPSQELSSRLFHGGIKSFGHALAMTTLPERVRSAGQVDIQQKGIAVGAYRSSRAFLLRTRPVIHLETGFSMDQYIYLNPEVINEQTGQQIGDVTVSFRYKTEALNDIAIRYSVTVDDKILRPRITANTTWPVTVVVRRSRASSITIPLYLTHRIMDFTTPVSCKLNYELDRSAGRNPSKPVLAIDVRTNMQTETKLALSCEDNKPCRPEGSIDRILLISPDAEHDVVIFGDTRAYHLEVALSFGDDAALDVRTVITLPSGVNFNRWEKKGKTFGMTCAPLGGHVECDAELIPGKSIISLWFYVRVESVALGSEVMFGATLGMFPEEMGSTLSDNNVTMTATSHVRAKIHTSRQFQPSSLLVTELDADEDLVTVLTFSVENEGPGVMPGVHLQVQISNPPNGDILRVVNETGCTNLTCDVGDIGTNKLYSGSVTLALNEWKAETIMNSVDRVGMTLEVNATVRVFCRKSVTGAAEELDVSETSVRIRFLKKGTEEFSFWIIPVAAGCGAVFMACITAVLCKCGFFRRRVKEELDFLKRKSHIIWEQPKATGLEEDGAELLSDQVSGGDKT